MLRMNHPLPGIHGEALVDGVRLETLQLAGNPRRPVLVFLHEGLGSVSMWNSRDGYWPQHICEATGHAGLVYSRRGYGQSDPIADVRGAGRLGADYMHAQALRTLPALLHALGIREPVLIGHSDGATIALLHASDHPVAACAVLAPHVMVEDISLQAIARAREAYQQGGLRERLARHHADVDSAFWQWHDVWQSDAFRHFDIRSDCRRITAPVLAIQGLDDAYGTLRQIEEIAPTRGHFEMLALPDCGHSPHKDQPAAVSRRLCEFIGSLSQPRPA